MYLSLTVQRQLILLNALQAVQALTETYLIHTWTIKKTKTEQNKIIQKPQKSTDQTSMTHIIISLYLYNIWIYVFQLVQMFPVYYIFNFLMTTLLILHTMWFYFIIKVALKVMMSSGSAEDARSDSDDSDDLNNDSCSDDHKDKEKSN